MNIPPAYPPDVVSKSLTTSEHQASLRSSNRGMLSPLQVPANDRPSSSTAFAQYLEAKRRGEDVPTPRTPAFTPQNGKDAPLRSPSLRSRPQTRQSQTGGPADARNSRPSTQQQRRPVSSLQPAPDSLPQTLRVSTAPGSVPPTPAQAQQQDVDYLSLTNAARSLAEAANSLANSLSPKVTQSIPSAQAQALAQAAHDLRGGGPAQSLSPPQSKQQPQTTAQPSPSATQPQYSQHQPQQHGASTPHKQPLAVAATTQRTQHGGNSSPLNASQALPRTPSGRQDGQNGLVPWTKAGQDGKSPTFRTASGASTPHSVRVQTPKFPPVNPIIAMQASQPPAVHTAAAAASRGGTPGASRGGLATPQSRPYTANPITHEVGDVPRPVTGVLSRAGSTQGLAQGQPGRPPSMSGRSTPGPGDAGSQASQVLSVPGGEGNGKDGRAIGGAEPSDPQTQQHPDSRTLTDLERDTFTFMFRHPDRVRLTTWPPPTSFTESEIMSDDAALKYNTALENMRQRIYTHGTKPVLKAFKIADKSNAGSLEAQDFKKVLKDVDFGPGLDEQVLNQIITDVSKNNKGKVDYLSFVTALRFNTLPNKPYNKKFKHRTAPNPDMPCGPPSIRYPYGTLEDKAVNDCKILNNMDNKYMDLKQAFTIMDSDADGYITFGEFKNAMKDLNQKFNLKLNEDYFSKAFREADWDYNRAVDWHEFVSTFGSSPGSRFVPEFMKPLSLRCSTLTAPWEDQRCVSPAHETMRNVRRPGTSDPVTPTTPLANDSARLLRSIQA